MTLHVEDEASASPGRALEYAKHEGPSRRQFSLLILLVFLNTLMKEMFSSIETKEESFGGGFAEETWRGMQAEQFANSLAEQGGIGLADQLMGDLLRLQEANQ